MPQCFYHLNSCICSGIKFWEGDFLVVRWCKHWKTGLGVYLLCPDQENYNVPSSCDFSAKIPDFVFRHLRICFQNIFRLCLPIGISFVVSLYLVHQLFHFIPSCFEAHCTSPQLIDFIHLRWYRFLSLIAWWSSWLIARVLLLLQDDFPLFIRGA